MSIYAKHLSRIDMYNSVLTEILRTEKVFAKNGNSFDLHSGIHPIEGAAIYELIKDQKISVSLEIGCAYGISSLYICDALSSHPSPHHTIIDPFQSKDFNGIGVSNLQKAGFNFFSLIEKPSEIVLPELLANEEKFQFILIDGNHTFDHTLLDFFYANRLLEDGGFVAIDDANWPSIRKMISYVSKYPNYRIYNRVNVAVPGLSGSGVRDLTKRSLDILFRTTARILPKIYSSEVFTEQYVNPDLHWRGYGSMVILQKTGPDTRSFDWYEPF